MNNLLQEKRKLIAEMANSDLENLDTVFEISQNDSDVDNKTISSEPTDQSNADLSNSQFHCQGKCNSSAKTFQYKDEFDLHMMYYHEQCSQ